MNPVNATQPRLALRMRAVSVGINLFKGVWNDSNGGKAHGYLLDESLGRAQATPSTAPHVATLPSGPANGQWVNIPSSRLRQLINNDNGEINLIFEGTKASTGDNCAVGSTSGLDTCYVEIELYNERESGGGNKPNMLAQARLYLDLRDVKDFYDHHTAGNADNAGDFDPSNIEDITAITVESGRKVDLLEGVATSAVIESDYVLFVHGWRMRKFEKIAFAETAFKRLYWSGYQGRFGMLSWPTGYFHKPAHIYADDLGFSDAVTLAFNTQNYDSSEVVARKTGDELANYVIGPLRTQNANANLHAIAHSMGNVVVSEMLRNSEEDVIDSYAASQTAESAGAYDTTQASMQHLLVDLPATYVDRCEDILAINVPVSAAFAWQCYSSLNRLIPFSSNYEFLGAYDIPPDRYQYPERPINWGRTDLFDYDEGTAYYEAPKNGFTGLRMVNFYNGNDAALTAWELNHLFKPDAGWRYLNDTFPIIDEWKELQEEILGLFQGGLTASEQTYLDNVLVPREDALAPVIETIENGTWHQVPGNVLNERYEEGILILPDRELIWRSETVFDLDSAQILGFITPARNEPLGQVASTAPMSNGLQIISSELRTASDSGSEYTDSNQDHSAQFYDSFSIQRLYWRQVIVDSADIEPNQLSGFFAQ